MYPLDAELESALLNARNMVLFLTELKELRKNPCRHVVIGCVTKEIKGKVKYISVTCSCGYSNEFRKPLSDIDDFECPRRPHAGKV